jgi:hypothetical protein
LSSIKMLAQIRKLGPAVQVNIAEQQINTFRQPIRSPTLGKWPEVATIAAATLSQDLNVRRAGNYLESTFVGKGSKWT